MDYLYTILASIFSVTALFFITKIMGNKQMAELNTFDYINGITIGSIAAELATEPFYSDDGGFLTPLIAMLVYTSAVLFITFLTQKSIKSRRFFSDRSIILLDNGKLFKNNFVTGKIDINEFMVQCRMQGYFDLSKVQTVVLESNGKLSILPKCTDRPLTTSDMKIKTQEEGILYNVILDGNIIKGNLENTGKTEKWLKKEVQKQGINDIKKVFLATLSSSGDLCIFESSEQGEKEDFFQ